MSATLLAFALAAEIGAAAPNDLKPCARPIQHAVPHRPRILVKPTHIRKLKEPPTDCAAGPPPSPVAMLFPANLPLLDYTPAPEQETFAAALEPTIGREAGTDESVTTRSSEVAGAAAFNTNYGPILVQQPALFQVAPAPELPTAVTIAFGLVAMGFVFKRRA